MSKENCKPSYLYLRDEAKKSAVESPRDRLGNGDAIVHYDVLIVKLQDGRTDIVTAYGDGAHVRGASSQMPDGAFYKTDVVWHNMQIERTLNEAVELTAIMDGKVVYRFPKAV